MKLVLDKMLELGFIDKKEYDSALNEKLEYKFVRKTAIEKPTTYFVDHVLNEVINDLIEQKNITRSIAESMVYNNGYKIYTTMDPFIQSAMDSIFMDPSYFLQRMKTGIPLTKKQKNTVKYLKRNGHNRPHRVRKGYVRAERRKDHKPCIQSPPKQKTARSLPCLAVCTGNGSELIQPANCYRRRRFTRTKRT